RGSWLVQQRAQASQVRLDGFGSGRFGRGGVAGLSCVCRSLALAGPSLELAVNRFLDDPEQVASRIAHGAAAAPCGPFVEHGLPLHAFDLLQGDQGTRLLLLLQIEKPVGQAQALAFARVRYCTYCFYTITQYGSTVPPRIPQD